MGHTSEGKEALQTEAMRADKNPARAPPATTPHRRRRPTRAWGRIDGEQQRVGGGPWRIQSGGLIPPPPSARLIDCADKFSPNKLVRSKSNEHFGGGKPINAWGSNLRQSRAPNNFPPTCDTFPGWRLQIRRKNFGDSSSTPTPSPRTLTLILC